MRNEDSVGSTAMAGGGPSSLVRPVSEALLFVVVSEVVTSIEEPSRSRRFPSYLHLVTRST
ncbi:hypothetical protein EA473_11515 [Natrarchaeobius chitinivorans]|uniref:Uncharacterized protein n=1 Tax=Natrarchaeobius chitinivorans TaxID=1679083 RepID=A0A3N6PC91_NATCH|nr:hypothetical protein EA473_11515 [Natrarchaeobius chitinivorans]